MSLVGVLKPSGGADVEVVALHVNFWALTVPITPRGIVEIVKRRGARKAFIDVGVRFRVKSGAIGGLPLILPADTALNDKVTDLSSLVLDESINDLIFGVVTSRSAIRYTTRLTMLMLSILYLA